MRPEIRSFWLAALVGCQGSSECPEGFDHVPTNDECWADAACFAAHTGWCTGGCPAGTELRGEGGRTECVPAPPGVCQEGFERMSEAQCESEPQCYLAGSSWCGGSCPEGTAWVQDIGSTNCEPVTWCPPGFQHVSAADECDATLQCHALAADAGWCSGRCPERTTFTLESDRARCRPFRCPLGFDDVATQSECRPEQECHPLQDGSAWCSGACPDDGVFVYGEDGVFCKEPPRDCPDGFMSVRNDSECLADATCFRQRDGSWCTGTCPAGTVFTHDADGGRCLDDAAGIE